MLKRRGITVLVGAGLICFTVAKDFLVKSLQMPSLLSKCGIVAA